MKNELVFVDGTLQSKDGRNVKCGGIGLFSIDEQMLADLIKKTRPLDFEKRRVHYLRRIQKDKTKK